MGATLRSISQYTPLGAAVPSIINSDFGHWPGTTHLLVLAAYTAGDAADRDPLLPLGSLVVRPRE